MLNIDAIKLDLAATLRDEHRLRLIVDNLDGFITHSHGENRNGLRADLMFYKGMLDKSSELRFRLQRALLEIEAN